MEISGIRMLIGLMIGIALLILLMLKTKIQAFLALIRGHATDCDGYCGCSG